MSNRLGLALCVLLPAMALPLPACGGGGGGSKAQPEAASPLEQPPIGDPNEAPPILFTIPAHAALDVLRERPIQVQFTVPIDPASVRTDSIVVEGSRGPVAGSARRTAESLVIFLPDDDLRYGDVYRVTLRPGIRSQSGEQRGGAYTFAFRAIEAQPGLTTLHEAGTNGTGLFGLKTNSVGNGMSVMAGGDGDMLFRRIEGGVPTGSVDPILANPKYLTRRVLDVAEGGNAQIAWVGNDAGKNSAFARQFNAGFDNWLTVSNLTPATGVVATQIDSEFNVNGGLVAWIEHDVGTSADQRAFAARIGSGGVSDIFQLGPSSGDKAGLFLSSRSTTGVVAFHSRDAAGDYRVHASRYSQSDGFLPTQLLDGANAGLVRGAVASPTGHLYVIFYRRNPADSGTNRWFLAVANPGMPFGAPLPLHSGFAELNSSAQLSVGDNGLLTMLYTLVGPSGGTWVRRYTPGRGLSGPAELTGLGQTLEGTSHSAGTLRADAEGNAVAAVIVHSGQTRRTVRAAILPATGPWTLGIEVADEILPAPTASGPPPNSIDLAIEPSGGALIVWSSVVAVGPTHGVVRSRRVRTDGALGLLTTYDTTTSASLGRPRIALTAAGSGLLLLQSTDIFGDPVNVFQVLID